MMENGKRKRAAADAGGEVGDLPGGHLAGDLAGRRGAEVRRRRERDHSSAGVGEGRGVGGVRLGEAGPAGVGARQSSWSCCAAENDRLGEALKEMAVELTLHRGRQRSGFSARSPRA